VLVADFYIAVALTLRNEGGFVNNANDPGGATNMGIEQRDLPNTPIQMLSVAQAEAYYAQNYWKPFYSQISNQSLANKLFDLGVLFGVGEAVKVLQQVLSITADGVFGPATLTAVNEAPAIMVLAEYKSAMLDRANEVVGMNPKEIVFLDGWERRINS
jgi:lysozyme family protein